MNPLNVFEQRTAWAVAILLCVLVAFLYASREAALLIPNFHLDGVYQTASAMTRLLKGDVVGRDFYFYLGLGPLYSVYPVFVLFGGNIAASIAGSHLVVQVSLLITFIFYVRLSFPHPKWPSVVVLAVLILWVLEYLFINYSLYFRYPNFFSYLDPGNSLRPLRRFAPILAGVLVYVVHRFARPDHKPIFYGLISGSAANWSNDYGIPTAVSATIIVFWEAFQKRSDVRGTLKAIITFAFVALAAYFFWIALATHGHVAEWLRYNFSGVSGDQWWYYKPYVKDRIWKISDFSSLIDRGPNWQLSLAIGGSFFLIPVHYLYSLYKGSFEHAVMAFVGLALFGGAATAEIFGHLDDYYWAGIMPWFMFSIVKWMTDLPIPAVGFPVSRPTRSFALHLCYFVAAIIALLKLSVAVDSYSGSAAFHREADNFIPELGGYVNETDGTPSYLAYMSNFLGGLNEPVLVEEYFGLASALALSESSVAFDSVIHALGDGARKRYLEGLSKAEYVVTTNPRFSHWQGWSLSENWWFYEYVVDNFEPLKKFENVVLWGRAHSNQAMGIHGASCEAINTKEGYRFDLGRGIHSDSLVELSFDFAIKPGIPSQRYLILVENGMSSLNPYTSLNLHANHAEMPVFVTPGLKTGGLNVYLIPEFGGSQYLEISSCHVRPIAIEDPSAIYFDERFVPLDLNYGSLVGGVSVISSEFYVGDMEANRAAYKPGKTIRFSNGQVRTIVQVHEEEMAKRIRVRYSGDAIAGVAVGYPNRIIVIEQQ